MNETYDKQHLCCPQCGGHSITRTWSGEKAKRGEPYRDNDGAKCNSCEWDGITHYLVPAEATPAETAGPQLTAEVIDSLIQTLRHRKIAINKNTVTHRLAEHQQLMKKYVKLVQTRTAFMDQPATEIALEIAQRIKEDLGDLSPDDGLLSTLRILCGTCSAVPANLSALYIALHGPGA